MFDHWEGFSEQKGFGSNALGGDYVLRYGGFLALVMTVGFPAFAKVGPFLFFM